MKNNVTYVNFSKQHRKKKIKEFFKNLFTGNFFKTFHTSKKQASSKSEVYNIKNIL